MASISRTIRRGFKYGKTLAELKNMVRILFKVRQDARGRVIPKKYIQYGTKVFNPQRMIDRMLGKR
jgi:hypothetical protein